MTDQTWAATVLRERGRGSEAAFIWLAADLSLTEQVEYLCVRLRSR
jgi:hypothetical protein